MPDDPLNLPDNSGPSLENLPEFAQNALAFEEFVNYLIENAEDYRTQASVKILRATIGDRITCPRQIIHLEERLTEENLTSEYSSLVLDYPTITVEYIRETIVAQIGELNDRIVKAEREYSEGVARIELTFVGKDQSTAIGWLEKDFYKTATEFYGKIIYQKGELLSSGAFQYTCIFEFVNSEE